MRQEFLADLGHEPSIEEQTWIDNFTIDQLKKRQYDMGILRGESFGSRDMGQAISESVNRRIMKKLGVKKPEKPVDLGEYLSKKNRGD